MNNNEINIKTTISWRNMESFFVSSECFIPPNNVIKTRDLVSLSDPIQRTPGVFVNPSSIDDKFHALVNAAKERHRILIERTVAFIRNNGAIDSPSLVPSDA